MMKRGQAEEAKAEGGEAAAHGGGGHGNAAGPKKAISFVELREMIINLSPEPGQDKGKFAKFRVSLEMKDPKWRRR